jgi:hypothetical protein
MKVIRTIAGIPVIESTPKEQERNRRRREKQQAERAAYVKALETNIVSVVDKAEQGERATEKEIALAREFFSFHAIRW